MQKIDITNLVYLPILATLKEELHDFEKVEIKHRDLLIETITSVIKIKNYHRLFAENLNIKSRITIINYKTNKAQSAPLSNKGLFHVLAIVLAALPVLKSFSPKDDQIFIGQDNTHFPIRHAGKILKNTLRERRKRKSLRFAKLGPDVAEIRFSWVKNKNVGILGREVQLFLLLGERRIYCIINYKKGRAPCIVYDAMRGQDPLANLQFFVKWWIRLEKTSLIDFT